MISVGKTLGAAAALILGRTLLNSWVQNTLKNHPHFSEVYSAMGKDTFKLAVMLRLSPVPSWVNNYGLALTPISLKYGLISNPYLSGASCWPLTPLAR